MLTGLLSGSALWYLCRATGVVSVVLLTAVVVLGVVTAGRRSPQPSGDGVWRESSSATFRRRTPVRSSARS